MKKFLDYLAVSTCILFFTSFFGIMILRSGWFVVLILAIGVILTWSIIRVTDFLG